MRALAVLLALAPGAAQAFCGLLVGKANAKPPDGACEVVIMRQDDRTVVTVSRRASGAAVVVPLPEDVRAEDVKTVPRAVLEHLDALTAARLVEHREQDPCRKRPEPFDELGDDGGARTGAAAAPVAGAPADPSLAIVDGAGAVRWLRDGGYAVPAGLSGATGAAGRWLVARADAGPLQLASRSSELRLSLPPAAAVVWVLHPRARFEAANVTNLFAPTNVEVTAATWRVFPAFYAALRDRLLARAGGPAVVTEHAWSGPCDPCVAPPLTRAELDALGNDRLGLPPSVPWTVTRLFARLPSGALVLREARAISGGREDEPHASVRDVPHARNTFQSRYVIRQPWRGPLRCDSPRRGVWGTPKRVQRAHEPEAARRTPVRLERLVRTPLP